MKTKKNIQKDKTYMSRIPHIINCSAYIKGLELATRYIKWQEEKTKTAASAVQDLGFFLDILEFRLLMADGTNETLNLFVSRSAALKRRPKGNSSNCDLSG